MQPQVFVFRTRQSKPKICREAARIASYLLIQSFRRYSIEFGQVRIKNDFLSAKQQDSGINPSGHGNGSSAHLL